MNKTDFFPKYELNVFICKHSRLRAIFPTMISVVYENLTLKTCCEISLFDKRRFLSCVRDNIIHFCV